MTCGTTSALDWVAGERHAGMYQFSRRLGGLFGWSVGRRVWRKHFATAVASCCTGRPWSNYSAVFVLQAGQNLKFIYTCTHKYKHTCINTYTHINTYIRIYIHARIHTLKFPHYIDAHTYIHTSTHIHSFIRCMYACIAVCVRTVQWPYLETWWVKKWWKTKGKGGAGLWS